MHDIQVRYVHQLEIDVMHHAEVNVKVCGRVEEQGKASIFQCPCHDADPDSDPSGRRTLAPVLPTPQCILLIISQLLEHS